CSIKGFAPDFPPINTHLSLQFSTHPQILKSLSQRVVESGTTELFTEVGDGPLLLHEDNSYPYSGCITL
ncbi:hypothetical protein LINPERPRIM_LOCUS31353, partial [Linum perenne]